MTQTKLDKFNIIEDIPLILNFDFTEESFFEFCQLNRDLRIERDENGIIHIMAPTRFDTGEYNANLVTDLNIWNRKHKTGKVGGSSTGYILPNGAVRAPDVSWTDNEKFAESPARLGVNSPKRGCLKSNRRTSEIEQNMVCHRLRRFSQIISLGYKI